ncbi:DUF4097 family beta strand repeat protein [bacterium]|nr:DUF4097 family beta strand repeat protein [FCB group bacterium]MBL7191283.1 DUF4097 family beta strand repeat protein [bacterium]
MNRYLKIYMIPFTALMFCLVLPHISPAAQFVKDKRGFSAETKHEFPAKKGGELRLSHITGDVFVDSWDADKILVIEKMRMDVFTEEEAARVYERYKLEFEESGNILKGYGPSGFRDYINVDYYVTFPRTYKGEIKTSGGDFEIKDLKGDYQFSTSGGDISMNKCAGVFMCATSGGDLELRETKGKLTARTSGGDIICIRCGDDLDLTTSGGDLDLRELSGILSGITSGGDIDLSMFEGSCRIKTSGGDIYLRNIKSQRELNAETSGGDIEVVNIEGDISVKTSGGSIQIQEVKGCVSAKTSGGDIEVLKVNGHIIAVTAGGDIEAETNEGYIEASTSGGDVTAVILKFNPKADQHVKLSSSGGDINLTLPADFKGRVDAVLRIQGGVFEEYNIYSDFPLKIEKSSAESGGARSKYKSYRYSDEITASGDINGGGNSIEIETTNGNIRIKKR